MKIKTYDAEGSSRFLGRLIEKELLRPGAVISKQDVEEILQQEYIEGDWSFLGKYIVLKTEIESRSFFITQAGLDPPSFRILKTEEMAEHATKKLTKALCINYKVAYIMGSHKGNSLTEKEQKLFSAVQNKAARIALVHQKILLDDFFLD